MFFGTYIVLCYLNFIFWVFSSHDFISNWWFLFPCCEWTFCWVMHSTFAKYYFKLILRTTTKVAITHPPVSVSRSWFSAPPSCLQWCVHLSMAVRPTKTRIYRRKKDTKTSSNTNLLLLSPLPKPRGLLLNHLYLWLIEPNNKCNTTHAICLTISQRTWILRWISEEFSWSCTKKIASTLVRNFP